MPMVDGFPVCSNCGWNIGYEGYCTICDTCMFCCTCEDPWKKDAKVKNEPLEDIGFYTLSDERAANTSGTSPMQRCELILTDRCNFKCAYCRPLRADARGDLPIEQAKKVVRSWAEDGLKNIRFSGGEPTIYPHILEIVKFAKKSRIERIAISTNGSADLSVYEELIDNGVNDISISLDGCCAADVEAMSGSSNTVGSKVIQNIADLSKLTYVTVGVVLTDDNYDKVCEIIEFADSLGVADIRVIPAAQNDVLVEAMDNIPEKILDKHPILKYRTDNVRQGIGVRGIKETDCHRCLLLQDDSVVAGDYHFPCIIYLREGGEPIGVFDDYEKVRKARVKWANEHDTYADPICSSNCLDVCVQYSNKAKSFFR